MNERVEKVKEHLRENKKFYLVGAGGIVLGAVGVVLFNKNPREGSTIASTFIPVLSYRPENNNVVIELVERSTPSKPVHLVGTGKYFPSLSEAAKQTGHSVSRISQQVNGKIDHVGGDKFEVLTPA